LWGGTHRHRGLETVSLEDMYFDLLFRICVFLWGRNNSRKSLQILQRNTDNFSYKEAKDTTQHTESFLQTEINTLATSTNGK